MDAEQLYLDGKQIIFAADSAIFDLRSGHFSTLYPLMTVDGKRIDASKSSFPDRGRVWWKIKESLNADQVLPGTIWVGTLEEAVGYDHLQREKDKYQVRYRDISRGHKDLIEVITVNEASPSLDYVRSGKTMAFDRPVCSAVFLKGTSNVLGPLRATWSSEDKTLSFAAMDAANPKAYRIPIPKFVKEVRQEAYTLPVNELHTYEQFTTMELVFTLSNWASDELISSIGTLVDATTDEQIINWAVKTNLLNLSNAQRSLVKSVLPALQDVTPSSDARVQHLIEITSDLERLHSLSDQVVAELGNSEILGRFIADNIDRVADKRIEQEIDQRRKEIEVEIEDLVRRKKKVMRDVSEAEDAYALAETEHSKKIQKMDTELQETWDEKKKELQAREDSLASREKLLAKQLEEAANAFRTEADQVVGRVLQDVPILQALGIGAQSPAGRPELSRDVSREETENKLVAPKRKPVLPTPLKEEVFLDNFRNVVSAEGFYFADDDLLNFHTCMKLDSLTVLAGQSGTGKSSLPRLYAKALGYGAEFLNISVKPDWLDDREFLGAYNPIVQCFEPGRTGLADKLIESNLDHDNEGEGLYVFNLDEANLARMEHYFAQFLSVLELPVEERILALFPRGAMLKNDPYSDYQQVRLLQNQLWTATINIDETVHFLSPKLIDRSQIVSLTGNGLAAALKAASGKKQLAEIERVSLRSYMEWSQPDPTNDEDVVKFLMTIHEKLKPSRMGLEHRALGRILDYVKLSAPYMSTDSALDFQIAQVIFPRLKRTAPHFIETVRELRDILSEDKHPRSYRLLERIIGAEYEEEFFQLL